MSQTTDRTKSNFTQQREQREQVAVTLATERLPWHPAIGERFGIERSAWRALVEAVFPSAKSTEGVILALSYCKARNLDPFKRVVHIVPIWQRGEKGQKGHYVETVWPGIGETRTTAMRTGNYGGCDDTKYGPDVERTWTVSSDDEQGNTRTKSVTLTFPEWAQVTIYRYRGELRYAIPGPRAYWLETYAKESRWSEIPNEMWLKRPRGQIEKCAEAGALRRGFPEEIGDEPTADEMGYGGPTIDPDGNRLDQVDVTPKADPVQTGGHDEDRKPAAQYTPTARASTAQPQTAAPRQATQTASAKSEPSTQQERKVEPKTEPKAQPAGEATTKAAQSSPLTGTTQSGFDPETGEIKDETQPANAGGANSEEHAFESWIVDASGNETTPDPYSDAMQFAAALASLCAGQSSETVATILENNDGAIADCRDASAPAAAIIDAIKVPKATVVNEPVRDQPRQEQGSTTNVEPLIEVIAVPQTPGGKPHWPNYAIQVKERFDRCQSAEEATAWMAKNKPAYFGKCTIATENQIQRHYDQTLTRFSGQSGSAPPVDADRELATKLGNELKASTSLDALRAMNQRQEVIDALTRWQKERPELFNELRAIGTARLKELSTAG